MNYLVCVLIKLALANICLLLVLFSDDGPSPFGYLKDGEFWNLLITVVDTALKCFYEHNLSLSILLRLFYQ